MKQPLVVNCPTCNCQVIWGSQSPHRPFCSKRCKMIDLGEWADEKRSLPGEDETHEDELAEVVDLPIPSPKRRS